MSRRIGALVIALLALAPAQAQELITKKQVFELASFTTQSGRQLKNVKVGWESYGTLNADKSNAILICHFFSGNGTPPASTRRPRSCRATGTPSSAPARRSTPTKYFVLSSDTLVNLNTGDPTVTTTGPASIDPETGKPYGAELSRRQHSRFRRGAKEARRQPRHQEAGHGRRRLHGRPPDLRVGGRLSRHGGQDHAGDRLRQADAGLIGWLDIWAMPIRLDPKWNGGDYYGKEPPLAGLAQALKIVTLHAQTNAWATGAFGAKWAKEGDSPLSRSPTDIRSRPPSTTPASARAKTSDANSFLYLVRANQLFAEGAAQRLKAIKAPALLIYSPDDLVFPAESVKRTAEAHEG